MPLVKCVHCSTENDPDKTSGYCDECGKKLPGIYTPARLSTAPKQVEKEPDDTNSAKEEKAGFDEAMGLISAITTIFSLCFGGIALAIGGVKAWNGVMLLTAVAWVWLFGVIIGLRGALASEQKLMSMSHWIGTKNPTTARFVCWLVVVLFIFIPAITILEVAIHWRS